MKVRNWSSNLGLPAAVVCVVIGSNFSARVNDLPVKFQSRIRRRNLRDFLRILVSFSLDLMHVMSQQSDMADRVYDQLAHSDVSAAELVHQLRATWGPEHRA